MCVCVWSTSLSFPLLYAYVILLHLSICLPHLSGYHSYCSAHKIRICIIRTCFSFVVSYICIMISVLYLLMMILHSLMISIRVVDSHMQARSSSSPHAPVVSSMLPRLPVTVQSMILDHLETKQVALLRRIYTGGTAFIRSYWNHHAPYILIGGMNTANNNPLACHQRTPSCASHICGIVQPRSYRCRHTRCTGGIDHAQHLNDHMGTQMDCGT